MNQKTELKDEANILTISIKDFFTKQMLKYSLLPLILTSIVMYILFFTFAGFGLDQMNTLDVQSTQTTIQNGVEHTDSFSAKLEGMAIIQFLMSYTLTSWIASFLVYTIGSFFILYLSIFVAVTILGFLTPAILKEIQKQHYKDVELIGHSNFISAMFNLMKWAFVMIMLFFILIPTYFIPLVNVVTFNLPLYYFFHKMITYDISSNICTKDEDKQIRFFSKNRLRIKTFSLYLISLIPFSIFFGAVFYVIYLGHTYFIDVQKIRNNKQDI